MLWGCTATPILLPANDITNTILYHTRPDQGDLPCVETWGLWFHQLTVPHNSFNLRFQQWTFWLISTYVSFPWRITPQSAEALIDVLYIGRSVALEAITFCHSCRRNV